MTDLIAQLPVRRPDLVIRPIGKAGRYVVKDPTRGDYFELGEEEHFLLLQLDGEMDVEAVSTAFETRFGEPLSEEDLDGFLAMAGAQKLLARRRVNGEPLRHGQDVRHADDATPTQRNGHATTPSTSHPISTAPRRRRNLLYMRKSVFDPDRLFTWLEPKIRFLWTRTFFFCSVACIFLAMVTLWTGRQQLANSFTHALRWETVLLAWLVILAVGTLHEFGHGLTCKHYGGEVREIGFLLLFLMPGLYCNVSDAWLFPEKSKRLWVTFAGGYIELFLWALAVFVWRVTMPDTLVNYLAFIVVAACGIKSFFNFNPLIKLDGYYLLSDWLEISNLRQRSFGYLMARLRGLLWDGPWPETPPRGRLLLGYGLVSWVYSVMFLGLMLLAIRHRLGGWLGVASLPIVGVLGIVALRGVLGDLFREEFIKMLIARHRRTVCWGLLLGGVVVASFLVPWTENASAEFEVRAQIHVELRAPVAGFLHNVHYDEGQHVSAGCEIARLSIPDLASRLARKNAELREAEAKLGLLRAGPRAEEITQQRRRVAAAQNWRDVAVRNLDRQQQALEQELIRFDKLLAEYQADCNYSREVLARFARLRHTNTITEEEYAKGKRAYLVASAKCEQTTADKRSRESRGVLAAESELAERQKELAHDQATLALLEAGTRPEEIEAAQATVERLREEAAYMNDIRGRLSIQSPVTGVITTRRFKENVGNYFDEGELLCEIEDSQQLEIVIALSEDQAAQIQPGRRVRLKARSLPFEVLEVKVERIAPRAERDDVQSKLNVYCRLDDLGGKLRSGMTGHARIECDQATVATVFARKFLRFIRTEFWL